MMRRRHTALLAAACAAWLALSATATAEDLPPAPRTFGYTLGDIIVQQVPLVRDGKDFELESLPPPGRVGRSFWRRAARTAQDPEGRRWLLVEYQIINAPPALEVWFLPPLQLKGVGAGVLDVEPWRFSIAPLTPPEAFDAPGLGAMRDDLLPAPVPLAPLVRRTWLAAAALGMTLLLWGTALYWRRRSLRDRLPFARALRDLAHMPDDAPQAWRRLQHALNDAAGQVVRSGNVDRLLASAPYLARERDAIEQFCREASALFFSGAAPAPAGSVRALARRLGRLERQYAA
ncbi:calcium incorporation protein MxaA [Noviherbaspirillum sp. 1P10PC]|uniref:calcium incorporation protein MxaA n=1 Tax=Noviherbaspirillum sp. 1P10PC TaxID=3132292 RepID=UPI0039A19083